MTKQNNRATAQWDGARLREARLAAAWRRNMDFPQSELARVVGVSPPTIGRYEKKRPGSKGGKTPNADMISMLAEAVGCDRGWLMFGPGQDGRYVGTMTALTVGGAYAGRGAVPPSMSRRSRGKRVTERRKHELPLMWYGDDATEHVLPFERRA